MAIQNAKTLGDYQLLQPLGRGGMGEVWLAEHRHLKKRYAVKLLPQALVRDENFVSRFHLEARVMADLDHPRIVRVHNFGIDTATYYLVMDYIEGPEGKAQTLADLADEAGGRLPEAQVRRLLLQVCEGLAYAHRFGPGGVVHRDLKPANILMDAHGNAHIADFGLAKVVGEDFVRSRVADSISQSIGGQGLRDDEDLLSINAAATLKPHAVKSFDLDEESINEAQTRGPVAAPRSAYQTSTGALLGTYDFMSPEQREGSPVDHRSDIYALGIIAYMLLTGRKPVGRFELPSRLVPGLPKAWDTLVDCCLRVNIGDRPRDVEQVADLLHTTGRRSRRSLVAGAVIALLACTVGLAWWGYNSSKSVDTPGTLALGSDRSNNIPVESTSTSPPKPTVTPAVTPSPEPTPAPTPEPTPAALANARPSVVFWEVPPAKLSWGEGQEFKIKFEGRDTDGGIDHYEWRLDGGKWEKTKKIEQPLGPLGAGQHVFEVVAVDAEGAKSEPLSHAFTVTNTAPTLAWQRPPVENETLRAPPAQMIEVKASDSDGKIAAYRFSLDTPRQPTDQAEATFKIEGLAEGPHTLYAWAVDDAGAVSERLERRFRFMTNMAPTVSLEGPTGDMAWRERRGVTVNVTCNDPQDGPDGVKTAYRVGEGPWTDFSGSQLKLDFDSAGEKQVEVKARDREGLESKIATQTIRIRGDNPPTVSARLEPEEILVGGRSQLTVAGSDPDGGEVAVSYKVADKAWQELEGGRLSLDGTQEGQFAIQVRVKDEDGREATQSLTLVVNPKGQQPGEDFTVDLGGGVNLEMVWIEGGSFMMGSPGSEEGRDDDEGPVHEVELDGFWMGRYEVTVGQFRRFVDEKGYRTEAERGGGAHVWSEGTWVKKSDANWMNPYYIQNDNHPVVCVTWNDAKAFCEWVSDKTGKTLRLPSEAQWEYGCRAGSQSRYCFGESDSGLGEYAWNNGYSLSKTHTVGGKRANAWGLYDMHGNVWEWCADWYGKYASGKQNDPTGPSSGEYPVLRGGSRNHSTTLCRSADRSHGTPDLMTGFLGFRVVCVARTQSLTTTNQQSSIDSETISFDIVMSDSIRQYSIGNFTPAREGFRQALEQQPDDEKKVEILFWLGETCNQLEDFPVALEYYWAVINLRPNQIRAWKSLERMSEIKEKQGDLPRALELLQQIESIYPTYPDIEDVKARITKIMVKLRRK